MSLQLNFLWRPKRVFDTTFTVCVFLPYVSMYLYVSLSCLCIKKMTPSLPPPLLFSLSIQSLSIVNCKNCLKPIPSCRLVMLGTVFLIPFGVGNPFFSLPLPLFLTFLFISIISILWTVEHTETQIFTGK